jgi:hypothetical protein
MQNGNLSKGLSHEQIYIMMYLLGEKYLINISEINPVTDFETIQFNIRDDFSVKVLDAEQIIC